MIGDYVKWHGQLSRIEDLDVIGNVLITVLRTRQHATVRLSELDSLFRTHRGVPQSGREPGFEPGRWGFESLLPRHEKTNS